MRAAPLCTPPEGCGEGILNGPPLRSPQAGFREARVDFLAHRTHSDRSAPPGEAPWCER